MKHSLLVLQQWLVRRKDGKILSKTDKNLLFAAERRKLVGTNPELVSLDSDTGISSISKAFWIRELHQTA
jgi:hypothetical protein